MGEGYWADDGNWPVHYPQATSGLEAAQWYVDGGDWGDRATTSWVTIRTWREIEAAVECASCCEQAIAHDDDGDPACAEHAGSPAPDVTLAALDAAIVKVDEDTYTISIDPPEPPCAGDREHDWQSPIELVGGGKENPGVKGHGAGVIITAVCAHCGRYREINTWAQNRDTGEQGLESVTYRDSDDASERWICRDDDIVIEKSE